MEINLLTYSLRRLKIWRELTRCCGGKVKGICLAFVVIDFCLDCVSWRTGI